MSSPTGGPDYNLGKASGRIVIETDERGFRRAEGATEDLGKSARRTAEGFQEAEKATSDFEDASRSATGTSKDEAKALDDVNKKTREQSEAKKEAKQATKELNDVLKDEKSTEEQIEAAINKANNARAKAAKLTAERALLEKRLGLLMKASGDRKVDIKVDVDDREAKRKLSDIKKTLRDLRNDKRVTIPVGVAKGGNKATAIGGAVAGGVNAAVGGVGLLGSGAVGAGAQAVVGVADAVGQLSGALGVLPGLIGAVETVKGTLMIATKGIQDAFEAAFSEDPEKLLESLKDLSSNAQDLVLAFAPLVPILKDIQKSIQNAFTANLASFVKPLADTYLPILNEGMTAISANINTMIQDLLKFMQTSEVVKDVSEFFGAINIALKNMQPAIVPIARAIQDIFAVSGKFLPQLAEDFTKIAVEASNWIHEMRESGKMAEWIQGGINAVKQLWEIAKNVGSALGTIFDIGNKGGGALGWLEKITAAFKDWTSSDSGKNAITGFFVQTGKAMDALMPVLPSIMSAMSELFNLFTDVGIASAPGWKDLFDGLATTFNVLKPIMVQMQEPMNQVFKTLGEVLPRIFNDNKTQLPEIMQKLADTFKVMLEASPEIITHVLAAVNSFLEFLPGIMDDIAKILPVVIDGLNLVKFITMGLTALFTQIIVYAGEFFNFLIQGFKLLVQDGPSKIGEWARGMWDAFYTFFTENGPKIVELFVQMFNMIWEFLDKSNLGDKILTVIGKVWDVFTTWLKGDGLQLFLDALSSLFNMVKDWIKQNGPSFLTEGLDVIGSAISTWFDSLPSKALDWGKNLIQGFIDGIKDKIKSVGGVMGDVAQEVQDWIMGRSPTKKGPLSGTGWTYYSGQRLASAFAEGISDNASETGAAAGKMAQYGADGANNSLSQFVKDATEFTGLLSSFMDIANSISDVTFKIIDFATHDMNTGESNLKKTWVRDTAGDKKRNQDAEDATLKRAYGAVTDVADGKKSIPLVQNSDGTWGSSDPAWDHLIKRESGGRAKVTQGVQDANSGGNEAEGMFQIALSTWKANGGTQYAPSPNSATPQQQADIAAKIFLANPSGSDWGAGLSGRENANALMDGLVDGSKKKTGFDDPTIPDDLKKRVLSATGNEYGLPKGTNSGGYGGKGNQFPDWVYALGDQFGVKPSTYPGHQESDRNEKGYAPNPNHENRGIDWTGSVENMQKFAEFLQKAAPGMSGLEQIIWQNPNTGQRIGLGGAGNPTTGYYPDTGEGSYAEHENHVHTRASSALLFDPNSQNLQDISKNTSKSADYDEFAVQTLRSNNSLLDQQLSAYEKGGQSDDQIAGLLGSMDDQISALKQNPDDPVSRAQLKSLEGLQKDVAAERGFTQADPQDTIQQVAGAASDFGSIASSVIGTINAGLKSVEAAGDLSSTLVRGIENTEDVMKIIDDVQVFIDFASKIAGTVGTVVGAIGNLAGSAGGADFGASGAIKGVAAIAGIVQGILDTTNAVIDTAQEVYKMAGKYVAKFVGAILGGPDGALVGDIKMLLDKNDWTLKAWSEDNPEDKRSLSVPGWMQDQGTVQERGSKIRDLNMYIGPGTDPNEAMNEGMWMITTDQGGVFSDAY